jgi:hypothetical protein
MRNTTRARLYGSAAKAKHPSFVIFVDCGYISLLARDETVAQITTVKSRDGRVGQFPAKFNVQTLRFEKEKESPAGATLRSPAEPPED